MTTSINTPAFEDQEVMEVNTTMKPATAVAVFAPSLLALATGNVAQSCQILNEKENAERVEFNSFSQVIVSNGKFVDRETKTSLGESLTFDLISYQSSYVVSPGDDSAEAKAHVRFSDDGVVCSDGTSVKEHLDFLYNTGYPDAALKERAVVVGMVITAERTDKFNDEPVQFDLSPSSRVMWNRYLNKCKLKIKAGKMKVEQALVIKATTVSAVKNGKDFSHADFSVAA